MSESANQAANWTIGLVGSIVLHVLIVGLFIGAGGSDAPAPSGSDEETESPTRETADTTANAESAAARGETPNGTPRHVAPTPASEPSRHVAPTPVTEPVRRTPAPTGATVEKVHVVQRGDNASKIARKYGLSLAELARLNGTTVQKLGGVVIGQKLKVAE